MWGKLQSTVTEVILCVLADPRKHDEDDEDDDDDDEPSWENGDQQ